MIHKHFFDIHIDRAQAGTYFTVPFTMPDDIETFTLRYRYNRHNEEENRAGNSLFVSREEENIIDLGLIGPDGTQVGASGSNKNEIEISETAATPGYRPVPLTPGVWQILVGAYKIAPEGVTVYYELTFTEKTMRLLKGDLHTHTVASDGVLTAEELARHALRHGLDFLAVTDHNQFASSESLPRIPGITLIPGVEWTHYQGHANFTGVDRPYDSPFAANTPEDMRARFEMARSRGALITINHPFEECCRFLLDFNTLPFDCLEIWNGPMRESNLRAVGLWQSMLAAGQKIPAVGGSDYHRDSLFQMLGGPTTCVFAMSSGPSDILSALKAGHAYISFAPDGPELSLSSGEAIMGDTVRWSQEQAVRIEAAGLKAGDIIRVVTPNGSDPVFESPGDGRYEGTYRVDGPGFARVEILRSFLPGIPMLPALISNPIYFD